MCACVQTQGLHIRRSLRWLLGRIARTKIHFCGFRRFMRGQAAFPTRPLLGEKSKDLWSLAQCANHISDATLAAWAHPSPSLCFPLYTLFFLFYIPSIPYSRSPVMIYCPSLSSYSFFFPLPLGRFRYESLMKDSRSLWAVLPTEGNDHGDRSANKQIDS